MEVVLFEDKYQSAFFDLNREWIETYFKVEAMDIHQLENPRSVILDKGGEIFVVVDEGKALGVCALIPHGENSFELAKMAVSPEARGQGIGDLLLESALGWARERGARSVSLLSNTVLNPAISLYKKHGFQTVRLGPHPDYQRCDIEMLIEWQ